MTPLVTRPDPADERELATYRDLCVEWISGYLARPHDEVGRDNAVCPFVEPSMQARSLEIRVWRTGGEPTVDGLRSVIEAAIEEFRRIDWQGRNKTLHALVVVLPDLPDDRLTLLDEAQGSMKTAVVRDGLMLGQFHPHCPDRAARNEQFLVSRSPVPMIALRNMAFHDVLFLHDRPEHFEAYARRYGHRYRPGLKVDPMFLELFYRAARENGLPLPLERWRAAAPTVRPTPQEYAHPVLDPIEACRVLGYDLKKIDWSADVDWLCEMLRPYTGPDGGTRYDYNDVANLGLAARTGRSVSEQAESMVMQFARSAPETWLRPRRWRLTLGWSCSEPACPGGTWRLPRPLPEHVDDLVAWGATTPDGSAVPPVDGAGAPTLVVDGVAKVRVTGEVVLSGAEGTLVDPRAEALYRDVLKAFSSGELAYQWMHDALRWNLDAALANGTADCVTVGLLLRRRAAGIGLDTRLRRGLLLGPVTTIEHFWVEVLDGGAWKPLDPVLALLQKRVQGTFGRFADGCAGSSINRLLPLGEAARGPLAQHDCPLGGTPAYSVVAFSPRSTVDAGT